MSTKRLGLWTALSFLLGAGPPYAVFFSVELLEGSGPHWGAPSWRAILVLGLLLVLSAPLGSWISLSTADRLPDRWALLAAIGTAVGLGLGVAVSPLAWLAGVVYPMSLVLAPPFSVGVMVSCLAADGLLRRSTGPFVAAASLGVPLQLGALLAILALLELDI